MTKLTVIVAVVLGASLPMRAEEPTGAPTVYTTAQAAAGRTAYQSACFNCHQPTLAGRKGEPNEVPAIASLPPGMQTDIANAGGKIPQLAGPEFMARWDGRTAADLAKRVNVASPFLKQAQPLLPEDTDANAYLNLAAYILQANGAQPGPQELTLETAVVIGSIIPAAATSARH